ncbi:MAG TPA: hypothetical protein VHA33_16450 [Candidatus Angelobacter sp.]|jgi:hypothetical protein|nr:hypothetical protein [Candidatus Angelobacter sp.]
MHPWLRCAVVCGLLMCNSATKNNELRFHLSIPKAIAAQEERRLAGDAAAPAPVLILHGLEFGANEGFKIELLGEAKPGGSPVSLAVTGVVGHPQRTPQLPLRKIDLPVPLNDAAAQLLANHTEVTIIVHFDHVDPDRPPVKIDSIYFSTPAKE